MLRHYQTCTHTGNRLLLYQTSVGQRVPLCKRESVLREMFVMQTGSGAARMDT